MKKKNLKIKNSRYTLIKESKSTPNIFYSHIKSNFEQFSKDQKRKMFYYNYDKETGVKDFNSTKLMLNKTGIKIKNYEKDFIKQVTKRNSWKSQKPPKINVTDDEEIVVNLSISMPRDNFYASPIHSLSVLKINNKVH